MSKRLEFPLAALLLAVSAFFFGRDWWGHWLFMAIFAAGPAIIVGSWLRLRRLASPLNLVPASLLLIYYTNLPPKLLPFLTVDKTASTCDLFLYYVDRSFGFSPSILVCHWVSLVPHLNQFFFGIYMALSVAMGACFAAHMAQERPPWRIVLVLAAALNIGVLVYNLLPACGPLMLLGNRDFLHGDAFAAFAGMQPIPVSLPMKFPRNAMPSLHMTWALLVLWISRDMRRGTWHAAIFAILTAVATLSTGEHYLVDLVVAFPFALAIWNLCVGEVPLSHPRRMLTIAGGAFAYLAWIFAIRFAPATFYVSPVLPWLASIATVTVTLLAVYSRPAVSFGN
ncbi:MAG: phosphatase PAP2 family protein [Terriglobales bacterium]